MTTPGYVFGSVEPQIEESAARALLSYDWPQNLTELRLVASWTVGRLRSPQITLAQLPERFLKIRMPSLENSLLTAQMNYIKRALRIFPNHAEAAEAIGIPLRDLDRGASEKLFHLGEPGRAPEVTPVENNAPSEPSQPATDLTRMPILLSGGDPVLRAAVMLNLPARGLTLQEANHGLETISILANRPDAFGCLLILGADTLLSANEIGAQAKRIAPRLKIALLVDTPEPDRCFDHLGSPPCHASDIEEAITRLLLQTA